VLIVFAGLPGVGKTAIARELARQMEAVYLRIDSIEQSLRDWAAGRPMDDAGYRAAYAIARDNLQLGRVVVADSVNPLSLTRDAWVGVATAVGTSFLEVEVTCSDVRQHRARIETREPDIPGVHLPTWQEVVSREYEPWLRERVVADTAKQSVEDSVKMLLGVIRKRHKESSGEDLADLTYFLSL